MVSPKWELSVVNCCLFVDHLNQEGNLFFNLDIHYYYNIDRCRIGGGVQVHQRPYVRGPIVFAVDQECSKVHYFHEGSSAWRKYNSARNITCSSHGIHFCAQNGARWTFSSSKVG